MLMEERKTGWKYNIKKREVRKKGRKRWVHWYGGEIMNGEQESDLWLTVRVEQKIVGGGGG